MDPPPLTEPVKVGLAELRMEPCQRYKGPVYPLARAQPRVVLARLGTKLRDDYVRKMDDCVNKKVDGSGAAG